MLAEMMRNDEEVSEAVEAFLGDFDHRSKFFQSHFFNIAKAMSSKAPVLHSPHYGGFSVVGNFEYMQKVSMATADFPNSGTTQSVPPSKMPDLIPADINPPDHGFYRSALNPLFAPSRMAALEAEVEALATALLEKAIEQGSAELVGDFAMPLTGRTSLQLIGFEPAEWPRYNLPIHNSTYMIGSDDERAAQLQQYGEGIATTIAELVKQPDPNTIVGALSTYEKDGRSISQSEINNVVNTLIIGGLGTTQGVISMATVWLARNPERRQELIDHPERIPAAVNEFIRVFPPAPFNGRLVVEDIEIGGHQFNAGETVLLFRPGANMDPSFIERPYEIDFQRKSSRMASFGLGPHMCLGQHLARLEFTVALRTLLRLAPDYELADEGPTLPPNFGAMVAFVEVPVRFKRR